MSKHEYTQVVKEETSPKESSPPAPKKKKKATFRENLESIAVAVLVALLIRQFLIEAFKIPTGSMAPTLVGEHKDVWCPNCHWYFALEKSHQSAYCPNCEFHIDTADYCPNDRAPLRMSPLGWVTWLGLYPHAVWCPRGDFRANDAYNRVWHGGNRILVNKLTYDFWSPQRWDVMVFVYPLVTIHCAGCGHLMDDVRWHEGLTCPNCGRRFQKEGPVGFLFRFLRNVVRFVLRLPLEPPEVEEKNFIKRIVGLPGEHVAIRNGDIYVNGKIARKPPKVQEVLWFPYYDSTYLETKTPQRGAQHWAASDSNWKIAPNSFEVDVKPSQGAPTLSLLQFRREIDDRYGYSGGKKGRNIVKDVKLAFDVTTWESRGGIVGQIRSGQDLFAFHLRSAGDKNPNTVTRSGAELWSDKRFVIYPRNRYNIIFYMVDATVGLAIDGKNVFRKELEPPANTEEPPHETKVAFGAVDTHATFTNVKIYRDVYYTDMGGEINQSGKQLGKDEYLALGDNSPNSKDSRIWGTLSARSVIGKALVVFWSPGSIKLIR